MTKNQIEYLKLLESQRSNKAQESLTAKRDATTRELGFGNLAETTRHNLQSEAHNRAVLDETSRHNVVVENETQRHNVSQEQLGRDQLLELNRHNTVTEGHTAQQILESARHNQATESIERDKAATQRYQADTQRYSALETSRHNLAVEDETSRHNVTSERETERSNRAKESETSRHNKAQESIGYGQISLGYSELRSLDSYRSSQISQWHREESEKERHNRSVEGETRRSNIAEELERSQHNRALEELQRRSNVLTNKKITLEDRRESVKAAENERHNKAVEKETSIHNFGSEINSAVGNITRAFR